MKAVTVTAKPSPFSSETYIAEVDPGQCLADIVGGEYSNVHATVEGEYIPCSEWRYHIVPEGSRVTLVTVPKAFLVPVIAAIASAVGAAATTAAASIGLSAGIAVGVGAAVSLVVGVGLTVGIAYGLSMAMNALVKPQVPSRPTSSSSAQPDRFYNITAGSNRGNPFGPIPKLYGYYRIFPPLAASYRTAQEGNDTYLYMLLCLGYGSMSIGGYTVGQGGYRLTNADYLPANTIRIGETDIRSFQNVSWEIGTREQMTIYQYDIEEQSLSVDLRRVSTAKEIGWYTDNVSAIRTTSPETATMSLDVVFPALYTMWSPNEKNPGPYDSYATVEFKLEYAVAGSGSWSVIRNPWSITGQTKNPLRQSITFVFPWVGTWDVRVTRLRTYLAGNVVNATDCAWIALRSFHNRANFNKYGVVLMGIRIKATGQLNGIVDNVSIMAQSVLPGVYGGATATSSPARCYLDALRGAHLDHPVPDDRIDLNAINNWISYCTQKGLTYNWYHQDAETLFDRLRAIATAGRASFAIVDGQFTVILDQVSSPVQLISPRNSRNFSMQRAFIQYPHALRVKYIDPVSYQQDERIVYDDGYNAGNATRYEVLETQGVTSSDQAFKEGRYFLAVAQLRPEIYSVEMDIENIVATRGDTVMLAYDSVAIGLSWGRITAITSTTQISVDQYLAMESGKTYGLRIRKETGSQQLQQIVLDLTLGGVRDITFTAAVAGLHVGDLFCFVEMATETLACKVAAITYQSDLSAILTLVPEAPGIQTAAEAEIPPWNPQISISHAPKWKAKLVKPNPPRILTISSGDNFVRTLSPGVHISAIKVSFSLMPDHVEIDRIQVRYTDTVNGVVSTVKGSEDDGYIVIDNLVLGRSYSVAIRARSKYGVWSDYSSDQTATAAGYEVFPDDVTGFRIDSNGDTAILTWNPVVNTDIGYYKIKYSPSRSGATWQSASRLVDRTSSTATSATVLALTGTYLIKAFDKNGHGSLNARSIVSNIYSVDGRNIVSTITESPTFSGSKTNVAVTSGELRLSASTDGTYYFTAGADLGSLMTSRLRPSLTAYGLNTSNYMDSWDSLQALATLSGTTSEDWESWVEVRSSEDQTTGVLMADWSSLTAVSTLTVGASVGTPTWGDWAEVGSGDYWARSFEFRARLQGVNTSITPSITALSMVIDMPDRLESAENVSVPAAGLSVAFAQRFRQVPAIGISAENLIAGDHYRITDKTSGGFTIQFFDGTGAAIQRRFDWLARGYGYIT